MSFETRLCAISGEPILREDGDVLHLPPEDTFKEGTFKEGTFKEETFKGGAVKNCTKSSQGLLLVDKPKGPTSFRVVHRVRHILGVSKVGHAGTLDPMATGLLLLLLGREYTKRSDQYLSSTKTYQATCILGYTTDSYDAEGTIIKTSAYAPSELEVQRALSSFQGGYEQEPPMFCAKKVGGKKCYDLARKGIFIEQKKVAVSLEISNIHYLYPHLSFTVVASKGTYIRSLAHDIGVQLGSFATLTSLRRTHSGSFNVEDAFPGELLFQEEALTSTGMQTLTRQLLDYL